MRHATAYHTAPPRARHALLLLACALLLGLAGFVAVNAATPTSGSASPLLPGVEQAHAKARKSIAGPRFSYTAVKTRSYTGRQVKPKVKVVYTTKAGRTVLRRGVDYTVAYGKNRKPGTGTIVVKGRGAYRGRHVIEFKIRYNLGKLGTVKTSKLRYVFKDAPVEPTPKVWYKRPYYKKGKLKYKKVRLKAGRDFTTTYTKNARIGTARLAVKGRGRYAGSLSRKFYVVSKAAVILDISKWDGGCKIDWAKLATQVDGVIMRSYVMYSDHSQQMGDECYDQFATACEDNAIPYGAYGFMNFKSRSDAVKQADQLWKHSYANGHAPRYLMLDIEADMMTKRGTKVESYTEACVAELQRLAVVSGRPGGVKVGLYIANHLYKTFGFATAAGRAYLASGAVGCIWIPSYGKNTGEVPVKEAYKPQWEYDLWQYTSKGTLSSVKTAKGKPQALDLSILNIDGPNKLTVDWFTK